MRVDWDAAEQSFLLHWHEMAEGEAVSHLTGLEKRMVAIVFDWLAENYTLEV